MRISVAAVTWQKKKGLQDDILALHILNSTLYVVCVKNGKSMCFNS